MLSFLHWSTAPATKQASHRSPSYSRTTSRATRLTPAAISHQARVSAAYVQKTRVSHRPPAVPIPRVARTSSTRWAPAHVATRRAAPLDVRRKTGSKRTSGEPLPAIPSPGLSRLNASASQACFAWTQGLPTGGFTGKLGLLPHSNASAAHKYAHNQSARATARVVALWQAARAAAGKPPLTPSELRARLPFMLDFYSKAHGAMPLALQRRAEYVVNWKAANNMVRENLFFKPRSTSLNMRPTHDVDHSLHWTNAQWARLEGEAVHDTRQQRSPYNDRQWRFTLVREPLARFVSGWMEFSYRHLLTRSGPQLRRDVSTEELAEEFVGALLDADPTSILTNWSRPRHEVREKFHEHLIMAEHYYPMSGVLATWPVDFVGRVEELRADWAALRAAYAQRGLVNLPSYEDLELSAGGHSSSRDPFGTRAGLQALLHRRPDLRQAVCKLLTPDYTCFGYPQDACGMQM